MHTWYAGVIAGPIEDELESVDGERVAVRVEEKVRALTDLELGPEPVAPMQ